MVALRIVEQIIGGHIFFMLPWPNRPYFSEITLPGSNTLLDPTRFFAFRQNSGTCIGRNRRRFCYGLFFLEVCKIFDLNLLGKKMRLSDYMLRDFYLVSSHTCTNRFCRHDYSMTPTTIKSYSLSASTRTLHTYFFNKYVTPVTAKS